MQQKSENQNIYLYVTRKNMDRCWRIKTTHPLPTTLFNLLTRLQCFTILIY